MGTTLYDLLEVSQNASQETITLSYQRLHGIYSACTDSENESATNQLIALREAFQTLSNPEKRKRYDNPIYPSRPARWKSRNPRSAPA